MRSYIYAEPLCNKYTDISSPEALQSIVEVVSEYRYISLRTYQKSCNPCSATYTDVYSYIL